MESEGEKPGQLERCGLLGNQAGCWVSPSGDGGTQELGNLGVGDS